MSNRAFVLVSPSLISKALFDGEVEVIDCTGLDQSGALVLEIEGYQLPPLDREGQPQTVIVEVTEHYRTFKFKRI